MISIVRYWPPIILFLVLRPEHKAPHVRSKSIRPSTNGHPGLQDSNPSILEENAISECSDLNFQYIYIYTHQQLCRAGQG